MTTPTTRWMRMTAREQARAIAAYNKLPFAVDEETRRLLAENAELRERIRRAAIIARSSKFSCGCKTCDRMRALLDLRRPLRGRR